jgi:predicted esterase
VFVVALAATVMACRDSRTVPSAAGSGTGTTAAEAGVAVASDALASASASASASALAPAFAPALAPVGGDWIEKIALPDGGLAYVTPPTGATTRRPVIVAVHGAVDDPGLMCGAWRLVADVYPFVVCPAGTPIGADAPDRKYVWGSSAQIEKRVLEAVAAVVAKYPQHVDPEGPIVYAGFSQGATMAAPFLIRHAKRFPRAVFTEGGHHSFESAALAAAYAKAGGERVLFTCSQGGCAGAFEQSRAALERAGVGARVVFSGAFGHSMPPPVRESVHAALPWVIEGLAGWEGYASAPKLPSH